MEDTKADAKSEELDRILSQRVANAQTAVDSARAALEAATAAYADFLRQELARTQATAAVLRQAIASATGEA
jgi:hypothetical protein